MAVLDRPGAPGPPTSPRSSLIGLARAATPLPEVPILACPRPGGRNGRAERVAAESFGIPGLDSRGRGSVRADGPVLAGTMLAGAVLAGAGRGPGAGAGRRGRSRAGQRQPDQELAAGACVAHGDLAGVRLDDAARDRQAEPGTFGGSRRAGRLAAERHVEDA